MLGVSAAIGGRTTTNAPGRPSNLNEAYYGGLPCSPSCPWFPVACKRTEPLFVVWALGAHVHVQVVDADNFYRCLCSFCLYSCRTIPPPETLRWTGPRTASATARPAADIAIYRLSRALRDSEETLDSEGKETGPATRGQASSTTTA